MLKMTFSAAKERIRSSKCRKVCCRIVVLRFDYWKIILFCILNLKFLGEKCAVRLVTYYYTKENVCMNFESSWGNGTLNSLTLYFVHFRKSESGIGAWKIRDPSLTSKTPSPSVERVEELNFKACNNADGPCWD